MRFLPHAHANVVKDNGNMPLRRFTDAIGANIVAAAQGFGFLDELRRFAAQCDCPISIEPKLFMRGAISRIRFPTASCIPVCFSTPR